MRMTVCAKAGSSLDQYVRSGKKSHCMVEGERRRCAWNPLYSRTLYPKRELGSRFHFSLTQDLSETMKIH